MEGQDEKGGEGAAPEERGETLIGNLKKNMYQKRSEGGKINAARIGT